MASVASQFLEEFTAHAQCDSLEDAWEICADGTYFPNNHALTEVPTREIEKVYLNERCSYQFLKLHFKTSKSLYKVWVLRSIIYHIFRMYL